MKPILVTTDFSTVSANATKYAADMALAMNATLHILHVLKLPVSISEVPLTEDVFNEMEENGKNDLNKLKETLEKQTAGKISIFTLLETGDVEYYIEEFCKRNPPFAVVMGIKKNNTERFMFGSSSLFAVKHLPYPLIIVPENAQFHSIKKIVLACDLSSTLESFPISYLKELQQIFHASFDVLNVNTKQINDLSTSSEFMSLRDMIRDLYPTYYFNIANTVEEGISQFLQENDADLLLLIPKKHGFFELHQSHTKKMALKSEVPIMAIHG